MTVRRPAVPTSPVGPADRGDVDASGSISRGSGTGVSCTTAVRRPRQAVSDARAKAMPCGVGTPGQRLSDVASSAPSRRSTAMLS